MGNGGTILGMGGTDTAATSFTTSSATSVSRHVSAHTATRSCGSSSCCCFCYCLCFCRFSGFVCKGGGAVGPPAERIARFPCPGESRCWVEVALSPGGCKYGRRSAQTAGSRLSLPLLLDSRLLKLSTRWHPAGNDAESANVCVGREEDTNHRNKGVRREIRGRLIAGALASACRCYMGFGGVYFSRRSRIP